MAREKRQDFFTTKDYEGILSEYVTSPLHLKLVMDVALPITPTSTINHVYRTFLWLLYSGMDADMTVCVKPYDIDFIRMRIRAPHDYTGMPSKPLYRSSTPPLEGYYPIYAEAVEDLRVACDLREFVDPPRGPHKERHCIRADGTTILRTHKNGEGQSDYQRLKNTLRPAIQNAVSRVRRHYEMSGEEPPKWFPMQLSCKKVETSGKFYRAYHDERMGTLEWFDPHTLPQYLAWRYRPEDIFSEHQETT